MSLEKKEAFFNDLGFKGAYSSLKEADDELDKIFDIEDDNAFLEAYKEFKDKYEDTSSLIQKIRMIYLRIFPLQMLNSNFWVVIKAI